MNLPNRPRVLPGLPVLRRRPDGVQIGIDSRYSLLIEDVPSPMDETLLGLTGRHTLPELREQLAGHGDQAADLVRLLHGLAEAGLVEETIPAPHGRLTPETTAWALRTGRPAPHVPGTRSARSVVVHGDGRLTIAVATLLAAAGVGHVRVVARGRVNPEDTGSGYLDSDVGRQRGEAANEAVKRASSTARTSTSTRAPDLVVLADALVPPPELSRALLLEGTPHLAVRAGEGLGVVGPLVVPGRSSCLRCADLHRTDADRGWPGLAAQLVDQPQQADLATVTATAGLATGQALLALDHGTTARTRPPAWDATLEVDAYSGLVEHRIAPVHPRCECRSVV
ncbi:bacteriocin biosynthesis cyclodehydratase domain-containing protein [Saccharothrix tamanrassetensis]|uniref:Bacteriocin biosynthesis cyclodehydratase domain-containing protein n=1 Tax=Saccharothrix tamanrassetensis TaxID=1051531 RepID=A0A841CN16_9PSEU|nr:TOMM precursor leader peptide-binding protein [Saccharothrix tamanrassetensis]MBB5957385.1 bacteriocin biosynthesis cyclodehydratase domain-containing protein [Saccharothrix tamanrassetensis]